MHIVIISCVYPPEPVVSARMAQDLASWLASSGHQVTLIAPLPSRISKIEDSANGVHSQLQHGEDRIRVVRLASYVHRRSSLTGRAAESWSFGMAARRFIGDHLTQVSVILANVWPVLAPALIARFCATRRIRFILWVQDLYPESLIERLHGAVGRIIGLPLVRLDKWVVRSAERVVVVAPFMREAYIRSRHLHEEKVVMIRNWQDERAFDAAAGQTEARQAYGIPQGRFVFMFLGNIGAVSAVDEMLESFMMAEVDQAHLVIAGEGSEKARVVRQAARMRASNVQFISEPDVSKVPLLQAAADVLVLPVKRGHARSSVPSKLIAYMFSARPILAMIDKGSDTARSIVEAQCGWTCEPGDVSAGAQFMRTIRTSSTAERLMMGSKGREYGLRNFGRMNGLISFSHIIKPQRGGEGK